MNCHLNEKMCYNSVSCEAWLQCRLNKRFTVDNNLKYALQIKHWFFDLMCQPFLFFSFSFFGGVGRGWGVEFSCFKRKRKEERMKKRKVSVQLTATVLAGSRHFDIHSLVQPVSSEELSLSGTTFFEKLVEGRQACAFGAFFLTPLNPALENRRHCRWKCLQQNPKFVFSCFQSPTSSAGYMEHKYNSNQTARIRFQALIDGWLGWQGQNSQLPRRKWWRRSLDSKKNMQVVPVHIVGYIKAKL